MMTQQTVEQSAQEMLDGLREQVLRFRQLVKAHAERTSALKREMSALEQMLAIKKQRNAI